MPENEIARPLSASQAQAARRYIKNMYDTLANDLAQFAADQEADVERVVREEHIDTVEHEEVVKAAVQDARRRYDDALETIAANARLNGFPRADVTDTNYRRVHLHADPLNSEVDRRRKQIRQARDRAFLRVQQARLEAEKTILLASMTPEVEAVVNSIPSAQELFNVSLTEIVR